MLKNYFTIAFRTLLKNKVFTLIHILGLAIGISASLVIYLLVNYHFSFDKFEKDRDRIYRVVSEFQFSGEFFRNSGITMPMGPAVKKDLTGLEAVVPFRYWDDGAKVAIPGENGAEPVIFKKQGNAAYVDSDYYKLIGYRWIAGSPSVSTNEPYQVVLTDTKAKLYFPKLDPSQIIGKEIIFNDTVRTTIAGVVHHIPKNTDFAFETFISKVTLEKTSLKPEEADEWNNTNSASQLLLKLAPGVTAAKVEKGIFDLYEKYRNHDHDDNSKTRFILQPISDLHFNALYGGYNKPLAHKPTLYALLAVAAFLLLLGCINFINLSTANAAQRAKEIGIRKTMGGSRKELIAQFLSETFLLTLISTILSIALTPLILKTFSGFIPDDLHFNLFHNPGIFLFLLVLMLVVTVLSGFYPALVMSGYKPVLVLKNQAFSKTGRTRHAWLRKSLTLSQFVIAQIFIMGAILVSKQIHYSTHKDLGFKKDAIIFLTTNYYDTVKSNKLILAEKLRKIPEIASISMGSAPPSSNNVWTSTMKFKDGKKEVETDVMQKFGDTNYIKLFGLKLLAGENVDPADTVKSYIINESYAHILGFQDPQKAIGQYLEMNDHLKPIIGVVSDFHQRSLHDLIKPLVIANWKDQERTINIALQPAVQGSNNWKSGIAKIEKAWKEVYPNDDFEYRFFDEDIAKFYQDEQHISSLLMWATGLAVFISCLGLLGLVIYITNHRTKEIGVRKVLGASVTQIVRMVSTEFVLLVLLAFLISVPVAWWGMNSWLSNYAYRTPISWWIFIMAVSLMLLIALITLGFQTIKAAMANPVKSLRTE